MKVSALMSLLPKTGQQSVLDKLGSLLVWTEVLAHFPLAEAQRFPFRSSEKPGVVIMPTDVRLDYTSTGT